jgi:ribosomal protein S18 acetylase RimI-like enzyme
MTIAVRQAGEIDLPLLLTLMSEFYAEAGYPLNLDRARAAFLPLLGPGALGQALLIEVGGEAAGHLVLTFGYSMEYGGRNAFVDDLFIRPTFRGRGFGGQLVAQARAICEELGVRAMHLEVARNNAAAQAVYRGAGFRETERQLLTLALELPTHAT